MKKQQRGFSLLMAMSVVTILLVGAAALFEQASGDLLTASGSNLQGQLRTIAELGSQWGQNKLIALLYSNGTSTTPDSSSIEKFLTPVSYDQMCFDGVDCSQFRMISYDGSNGGAFIYVGNGYFRAGVACQPLGCNTTSPTSNTYFLRVQAYTNGNSSKYLTIETVLGYAS